LGQGSTANRDNSVSVGNAANGLTRQITNVAPATHGTDAANLNQLNQVAQKLDQVTQNTLDQAQKYAAQATANALAQATPQLMPGQSNALAAKVGYYGGESAIGLSYAHQITPHEIATVGLSAGTSNGVATSVGVQFGW
jgi:autotransporter adhesin